MVYSKEELDKLRESPWGTTNREQKLGLEFSIEQYKELQSLAKDLKLDFIVSCWDTNSIDDVEGFLIKRLQWAAALFMIVSPDQPVNKTTKDERPRCR